MPATAGRTACRRTPPKHLVFASSSSVYGAGAKAPFREEDNTDQPVSYYGATKKANELMAHSYALNHGLAVTGRVHPERILSNANARPGDVLVPTKPSAPSASCVRLG